MHEKGVARCWIGANLKVFFDVAHGQRRYRIPTRAPALLPIEARGVKAARSAQRASRLGSEKAAVRLMSAMVSPAAKYVAAIEPRAKSRRHIAWASKNWGADVMLSRSSSGTSSLWRRRKTAPGS